MKNPLSRKISKPLTVDQKIRRRTFISFTVFAGANALAYGTWRSIVKRPNEAGTITAGAKKPLRRALNRSELAFRRLFSNNHLVETYPKARAAKSVRENGNIGLDSSLNVAEWMLTVTKASGQSFEVSLDELKKLQKSELIFDFKCVEGWDQIQHWSGVKLIDFMEHYGLQQEAAMQYVGLETPDREYYVGIDMDSALHPQTMLAYEMNDEPLSAMHGAPLRLIIPVKYGIKNLKRIGTITFSNQRPPDYWAEQGYDYYSGL